MLQPVTNVKNTILKERLLSAGDTVLVALSGGADSVTLLRVLLSLQQDLGLKEVRAVHVHHGLRGETADRDERFVRELCASLAVPLSVYHVNTREEASLHGESLEEAARRLRYAALESEADTFAGAKIATAHSLDDQAETVLLNLLRGSGMSGLAGIPFRRGRIVRPLLTCTAQEIRAFCAEQGYAYVEDETNIDESFSRNRIRHTVLPSMHAINSSATRHIASTAQLLREEDELLESQATALYHAAAGDDGLCVAVLQQAPKALVRRVLRRVCEENGARPERQHLYTITERLGESFSLTLPGAVNAHGSAHRIRFSKTVSSHERLLSEQYITPPCDVRFSNENFRVRCLSKKEYKTLLKIHKNLFYFCVSYDMIGSELCLRARKEGDRIRPFRRGCSKSVKKWMNEQKIPCKFRDTMPILCDSVGVLLIPGRAVDERAAVTEQTTMVLYLESLD